MPTNERKKYADDALEQVPEEHRSRGVAAGVGEKSTNGGGR
jgi:hypothetical protein